MEKLILLFIFGFWFVLVGSTNIDNGMYTIDSFLRKNKRKLFFAYLHNLKIMFIRAMNLGAVVAVIYILFGD